MHQRLQIHHFFEPPSLFHTSSTMVSKHQSYPCKFLITILFFYLLFPILVSSFSNCVCEQELHDKNTSQALKYKLVAITSILCSGALGVSLPFMVQNIPFLHPDRETFFLIKAFAAGVILATGFIHILPDAIESLTSPCLAINPWHRFPFTGFVAMVSAITTFMMESLATGYQKRSELKKPQPVNGDEEEVIDHNHDQGHGHHDNGGHGHGSAFALDRINSAELVRHQIVSQILEVGIVVHSVIIGLSLGASESPKTIKPLVAALSFHQFFEGMGLGGCICQARFKSRAITIMVLFFSLTTPSGIAVGIGISNSYSPTSPTVLIVQGLLNAASAGILIYMALVDLLAAELMKSKLLCNFRLQIGANLALLLGASSMSFLAKWERSDKKLRDTKLRHDSNISLPQNSKVTTQQNY